MLTALQNIFTNRELALILWGTLALILIMFSKKTRELFLQVIETLFCKKFIEFYIIVTFYFLLTIYFLYSIGFWGISLLKDTVFWILFVEFPLLFGAMNKADDANFFKNIITQNFKFMVVIEFLMNFWTFDLQVEVLIVPISVFFAMLYAISEKKKEYKSTTKFLNMLQSIAGIYLIFKLIKNVILQITDLLNFDVLKAFLLPFVLLVCTLPLVYGLTLYNKYEQIFFRLKGNAQEQRKMKVTILKFVGFKISRGTAVLEHISDTLMISLNNIDLKKNLKLLSKKIDARVGENYMKRPNYYILCSIILSIVSLCGLILCNSQVSIMDLITFNFAVDIERLKNVLTYVLATGLVFSVFACIYSIGFKKKKFEDLMQLKKFAFHDLFYLISKQFSTLQEFVPMDSPIELFVYYIKPCYEIKIACDKALSEYEHLFSRWEKELVISLQSKAYSVILTFELSDDDVQNYNILAFAEYFAEKTKKAPQNEKINIFTYSVTTNLEKYSEQIKLAHDEFKHFLKQ